MPDDLRGLGLVTSPSPGHALLWILFGALAVLAAGVAALGAVRRTPRDRLGIAAGVGALAASGGIVAATSFLVLDREEAVADIGVSAAFLLCFVLLVAFVGVGASRA